MSNPSHGLGLSGTKTIVKTDDFGWYSSRLKVSKCETVSLVRSNRQSQKEETVSLKRRKRPISKSLKPSVSKGETASLYKRNCQSLDREAPPLRNVLAEKVMLYPSF